MTTVKASVALNFDKGTPIVRPRGLYSPSETYVYDNEFRDMVEFRASDSGGVIKSYYFLVRNRWDKLKGVVPVPGDTSSSRKWEQSSEFKFITAESIVADMIQSGAVTADKILAGAITSEKLASDFIFTKQIQIGPDSANINFSVDANGIMNCKEAKVQGEVIATSGSFTGSIQSSATGARFVIDPFEKTFKMIGSNNKELSKLSFYVADDVGNLLATHEIKNYIGGMFANYGKTILSALGLHMYKDLDASLLYSNANAAITEFMLKIPSLDKGTTSQLAARGHDPGMFVVDTGQNSNGYCMVRIKI